MKKKNIESIRKAAAEILTQDFLKVLPYFCNDGDEVGTEGSPRIVSAIGHRWGAAFPITSTSLQSTPCEMDLDHHFVACGDYFGELSGRLEGAYLSGNAAANLLCKQV